MEKEVEVEKRRLILNRLFLHIFFVLYSSVLFAQDLDPKTNTWKSEKDFLEYRKAEKYKGPDDWYGTYPANMNRIDDFGLGSNGTSSGAGVQYSPQQIQKDRQRRLNTGEGKGELQLEPEVERPDPIELPEFEMDPPDFEINPPDIEMNPPNLNWLWKLLLFLLISSAIIVVIYLILKNRSSANKKLIVEVENDWNPEVVTIIELDQRLKEAMNKKDYRACVRIYFTFILKELMRKSWIKWKKEKTNHHYVMEMVGRPNHRMFVECVRIYDLVWYGDYQIDEEVFEMIQPILKEYYQLLNTNDE